MRVRNRDFIDRYLDLERKQRRRTGGAIFGDWYDLSSHLSASSPEIVPMTDGFAVRSFGEEDNMYVQFRGGITYLTDSAGESTIFDTPLPSEYIPEGDWIDIFGFIDQDGDTPNYWPITGGWSFNVGGLNRFAGEQGHIYVDDDVVAVVDTSGVTPVLKYPTGGQNSPQDGHQIVFNGAGYALQAI